MRRAWTASISLVLLVSGCSLGSGKEPPATSTSSSRPVSSTPTLPPTSAPAVVAAPGADSSAWTTVDAAARQVAGTVAMIAAVVTPDGQLQVVHQSGPTDVQPIASVTKLYVMIALLDAVAAGRLSWDTPLTVQHDDIAGGSGSLAGRGIGAQVSVQQAARMMFQISDNTATSLLVRTLGQPAMAAAVRESGHSRPELLAPFLTIRQDLWLVYSASPAAAAARAAWPTADTATRTRLLAPAAGGEGNAGLGNAHLSVGIGYYASTLDVARAWAAIGTRMKALGTRAGDATNFMQVNSSPFAAPADWRTVWFKSGSIGAAQNGAWYSPGSKNSQVLVVLTTGGSEAGVRSFAATAAAQLDRYAATH